MHHRLFAGPDSAPILADRLEDGSDSMSPTGPISTGRCRAARALADALLIHR